MRNPPATFLSLFLVCLAVTAARAADELTSSCIAIAGLPSRQAIPAAFDPSTQAADEVAITYVGHSSFRIRSPQGVTIVTDYAGNAGFGPTPDVVTMNHAHSSHFTNFPDPAIAHVLPGWNEKGFGPIKHRLQVGDVLIRNVATDLYAEGVLIEENGNSIFIFETAGLCLGHLGHLHHKLTPEHIAAIGRIDILFAPVDGNYTMSLQGMAETAEQLRSSILIPMHWFSSSTLQRFIDGLSGKFPVELANAGTVLLSRNSLPTTPKILVLSPY